MSTLLTTFTDFLVLLYHSLDTNDVGPIVMLSLLFLVVMRKINGGTEDMIRFRGETTRRRQRQQQEKEKTHANNQR